MRRQRLFPGEAHSLLDQPIHLSPVGWRVRLRKLSDPGAELRTAYRLVAAGGPPYSLFTEDPRKGVHLIGSPPLRPVAMATPSLQSFLQAWELPKEPAAAVQMCLPVSQGCPLPPGRATPGWAQLPLEGALLGEGKEPFLPSLPGAWNSASFAPSCLLLSRALEL